MVISLTTTQALIGILVLSLLHERKACTTSHGVPEILHLSQHAHYFQSHILYSCWTCRTGISTVLLLFKRSFSQTMENKKQMYPSCLLCACKGTSSLQNISHHYTGCHFALCLMQLTNWKPAKKSKE